MKNIMQIVGLDSVNTITESFIPTEEGLLIVTGAIFKSITFQLNDAPITIENVQSYYIPGTHLHRTFEIEIEFTMSTADAAIFCIQADVPLFNYVYTTATKLIPDFAMSGTEHIYLKDSMTTAVYDPDNIFRMQGAGNSVLDSVYPDDWTKVPYAGADKLELMEEGAAVYLLHNQNKAVLFSADRTTFTDFDVPKPKRFTLAPYGRLFAPVIASEDGKLYHLGNKQSIDLGVEVFLLYEDDRYIKAVPVEKENTNAWLIHLATFTISETLDRGTEGFIQTWRINGNNVELYNDKVNYIIEVGFVDIHLMDIIENPGNNSPMAIIARVQDHETLGGQTYYAYYYHNYKHEVHHIHDIFYANTSIANSTFQTASNASWTYYDIIDGEWKIGGVTNAPLTTYRDVYDTYTSGSTQGVIRLLTGPDADMEELITPKEDYVLPDELVVRRNEDSPAILNVDIENPTGGYLAQWRVATYDPEVEELVMEPVSIDGDSEPQYVDDSNYLLQLNNMYAEEVTHRWFFGHNGSKPFTIPIDIEGDKTPENLKFIDAATPNKEFVSSNIETILDVDQDVVIDIYMYFDGAVRIHEFSLFINGIEYPAYATDEDGNEAPIVYQVVYGDTVQLRGESSHVYTETLTYVLRIHKSDYPWNLLRDKTLPAYVEPDVTYPESVIADWLESDLETQNSDTFDSEIHEVSKPSSDSSTALYSYLDEALTERNLSVESNEKSNALTTAVVSFGENDEVTLAESPKSIARSFTYSLLPSLHAGSQYFDYETHLYTNEFGGVDLAKASEYNPGDRPISASWAITTIIANRISYDIGAITPAIGFTANWKETKSYAQYSSREAISYYYLMDISQREAITTIYEKLSFEYGAQRAAEAPMWLSWRDSATMNSNIVLSQRENVSHSYEIHLSTRGYASFIRTPAEFRPRETSTETNIRAVTFAAPTGAYVAPPIKLFASPKAMVRDNGLALINMWGTEHVSFDELMINSHLPFTTEHDQILADLLEYESEVLGGVSEPSGRRPGYFETAELAEQDAFDHGYNHDDYHIFIWEPYADHWVWSIRIAKEDQCAERVSGRVRGG